ncbi:hypothetical protein AMJ74_00040 [candidate division WOR_3 bacterium SM1_77]|uniref:Secretion system C-terminal sorting domain-containing protein n=1 Tax=candidate division WOR_3 bacterium SM1_77 TaxID=1703778 RepID=A0A0S8K4V7_UNCW3|nr:MAG: hypothetical protein AMJ74_00040 [candidate division WOR_3 bacterium SM1_77]
MPNLDITRHVNPDSQRTVICYHYWPGGNYRSWIDIDSANLAGSWPNNPKDLPINDHIWPRIAVTQNNTILLATGDNNYERNHLYRSTDFGDSWDLIADFDSIHKMGHFLRASHFPGSQKAVFVYTQYFCDTSGCGCRDQDVWYMTTGDNGMTWSDRIDLTNYQPYPIDSARVYVGTNAVYDANDNLHIAWSGRKVTDYMYEASKIFHWDEVHDVFSVVNSPSIYYYEPDGWWIATATSGSPGAYHMPAMDPQLIVDTTSNWLYCLWQGNDDYNDCSAGRYFNGELYGSVSMDSGLTWSDYVNLTNTRSPGAGPGACMDEDYMTAYPYVVNDSIYITFIEDKDAGGYVQGEGILTENPVRCWVFHKDLIPGIKEKNPLKTEYTTPMLDVYPNPFRDKTQIRYMIQDTRYMMNGYSLKIFDAAGQLVRDFSRSTPNALHPTVITWDGSDNTGKKLPGGVYFLEFEAGDYKETKKLILLK